MPGDPPPLEATRQRAPQRDRIGAWLERRIRRPIVRWRLSRRNFDYRGREDELIVYHHLGLGDHFICMGLVLEIADRFTRRGVQLVVKRGYIDTVRALYADHPQVRLLPVDGPDADRQVHGFALEQRLRVARFGFGAQDPIAWDRSFYAQAGIDFALSWTRFAPGDVGGEADALFERLVSVPGYQLVHDDASIGHFALRIPPGGQRIFVRPQPSSAGLLAWTRIIREAPEIHCIDSSVVHLVDRMPEVSGQRLFLHDARGSGCTFTRRRAWELIEYPRR